MNSLAIIYGLQGKYMDAEALARETLDTRRRVLGPEHGSTLSVMDDLANIYAWEDKYLQAEAMLSQALEIVLRVFSPEEPLFLYTLSNLASVYQRQGKYGLAETYARQVLARRRHDLGPEHPETMASAADLALAYQSQGEFAESEALARGALEFYRKNQPNDWQRFDAESLLGASLAGQKRYTEAEALLLPGYQGMKQRENTIPAFNRFKLQQAGESIVRLYQDWGKPDNAAEWWQKLKRDSRAPLTANSTGSPLRKAQDAETTHRFR
jgi:tetratricopeptide (TPR) repeat protein